MAEDSAPLTTLTLREALCRHTDARVALPVAGQAIATSAQLLFQLDHALARDAVHAPLDAARLEQRLRERGLGLFTVESAVALQAGAVDARQLYLRRPDLGRTLSPASRERLGQAVTPPGALAIILADGLSAVALDRHAIPLLDELLPGLDPAWPAITLILATQARVALADEIGAVLHARMTVILIGERPGLSAPDSLGAYLTWNPGPGLTDADRNCISNIRPGGLTYAEAASRILAYITEARRLAYTGVNLKQPGIEPRLP